MRFIKNIFIAGLLILTMAQCGVHKDVGRKPDESGRYERNTPVVKRSKKAQIKEVVNFAQKFVGVSYRYGGKTPESGFDCSGFVSYAYKRVGVNLSPASSYMALSGKKVKFKKIKKGDLMFFTGSDKNKREVGHVALVVNNDSGIIKMIHASSSRGVVIDTYNTSKYYNERFLFAKRIIY